ncbi:MAG: Rhodanese-related sulfurtransferase YibN [uncultured Paraburkholderia sp.]|nr:MAG: Rhodanese-related sulfurtransferase YibN [uncultured Paraburkholderia sp.]CAH2929460.1 MAG: Rhodanese-related sulfurtransferase YibN [uncultured Paraburkholderia sp.]
MTKLPFSISLFFGGFSVKFFTDYTNLVLIAIVLISGGLLLWPTISRRGLSAAAATQLINRRNAAVIDLRSSADFAKRHLPSARHLEFAELQAKVAQLVKNKSNPVLLVCQTGQQSNKAARIVQDAGYAEVHVLDGGVDAWQKAGMPIVKQSAVKQGAAK